eukprot:1161423-Pelagomonas_calceolata.AAC.14
MGAPRLPDAAPLVPGGGNKRYRLNISKASKVKRSWMRGNRNGGARTSGITALRVLGGGTGVPRLSDAAQPVLGGGTWFHPHVLSGPSGCSVHPVLFAFGPDKVSGLSAPLCCISLHRAHRCYIGFNTGGQAGCGGASAQDRGAACALLQGQCGRVCWQGSCCVAAAAQGEALWGTERG